MGTPPLGGGAQKWDFQKDDQLSENSPPTTPPQYLCAPAPSPVHRESDAWRHLGEIADDAVRAIGLQAIRFHLNRATRSGGCQALASIREANAIRNQLGLTWEQAFAAGDDGAGGAA